jgi:hypothetical protein
MPVTIPRPRADEYAPFYSGYVSLVPDADLVSLLREQHEDTVKMLRAVPAERASFAYAPGKWTVKEVIGHLCDSERIFTYRALRFARGDAQPLTGFDENHYVPAGRFGDRAIGDLVDEFEAIRSATIHVFRYLDQKELERRGVSNNNPISVRAIAYVVAGHERHHVKLLHERYGL